MFFSIETEDLVTVDIQERYANHKLITYIHDFLIILKFELFIIFKTFTIIQHYVGHIFAITNNREYFYMTC